MTEGRRSISPRLHASLDLARGVAACYVILHHIANANGWSHGFGLVFRFGQEAVMIFFLLSGFVIFANERDRAIHPSGYYLRRFRRIYPTLTLALIVSTLITIDNGNFHDKFSWKILLGNILNIQDMPNLKPGVIVGPYLGNDPLWSLSYEVFFYALFPIVLIFWKNFNPISDHFIGLLCCICYILYIIHPNHWALVSSYFLVWWCGAMTADAYLRQGRDFRSIGPSFYWLIAICLIAGAAIPMVGYNGLGLFPVLPFRHFIVAGAMIVALYGPLGAALASIAVQVARPVAAVASVSYGLYLLHYPILIDWRRAQSPWGTAGAMALLLVLAYAADRGLGKVLPRAPTE